MFSYDGLNKSRSMATVRLVSSKTMAGSLEAFWALMKVSSHLLSRTLSSESSSATRFPSATVRTMTPKFLGLMLCMSCFNRARSSADLILEDTDTLSWKGISTRNRPGKDSSHVRRGPLVEMGSLTICTNISCPCCRVVCTLPSFSRSGRLEALAIGYSFFLSLVTCLRYLV